MEEAKQQGAALAQEEGGDALLLAVVDVEVVARQRAVTRMGRRRRRRGGGRQHARSWGEEDGDDVSRNDGGFRLERAAPRRSEGAIATPVLGKWLRCGLERCVRTGIGRGTRMAFFFLSFFELS